MHRRSGCREPGFATCVRESGLSRRSRVRGPRGPEQTAHARAPGPLGREPFDHPVAVRTAVAETIVQAVIAVLPELVSLGDEAIAAPMIRPSNIAVFVLARELGDAVVDLRTIPEHRALLRCGRRELRSTRARGEVGVGLLTCYALDTAFDPHLPTE